MKLSKSLAILLFTSLTFQSFGQIKKINIEKSLLNWTGKAAFSSYTLTGHINPKRGEIEIKSDSIIALTIVIDMKSISHEYKDLVKHLKSKDFFDVKKFEEAYFELTKPSVIKDNIAVLTGNMTIKNVTHQESITINLQDNYNSISFNVLLDRTKYGIKFNSPNFFKKLKENAIADEFKLEGTLNLETN